MNLRLRLGLWLAGTALLVTASAQAVEIMQWERIPLSVPLHVGEERIVFVDQNVRVGIPPTIAGSLRVQSVGGAIYFRASEEIPPTRLQLQNVATGEIMLVDIAATAPKPGQASLEPAKIIAGDSIAGTRYGQISKPSTPGSARAQTPSPAEEEAEEEPRHETPSPVALTRYAAQMLYAPLRTVEPVAGIQPVRVDRKMDLSTLLPTLPVEAVAIGAWQLDNTFVTAIKLRNLSPQQLTLNPRDLLGSFATATYQHPYLGPRGNPSDTTTLYLVTQGKGLKHSLLPSSVNQIDPKMGGEREHSK
ncbi:MULTISPECIES: TIGR03749 family integrating conjugative element protein [unclassified Pseudomonas]|uniref:TIGR03749 family integrating conjugative element protein n=1 Tax=unclassified Pseudomonas TaxID=196821 RepID=UPI000A1EB3E8|nr:MULTISPECIES: TIGR03749 family integrating conjugative element protein [unclassified Pseudomonas]